MRIVGVLAWAVLALARLVTMAGAGEAELKRLGMTDAFRLYDGARHAFFAWYRPNYRKEQARTAGTRCWSSSADTWRGRA